MLRQASGTLNGFLRLGADWFQWPENTQGSHVLAGQRWFASNAWGHILNCWLHGLPAQDLLIDQLINSTNVWLKDQWTNFWSPIQASKHRKSITHYWPLRLKIKTRTKLLNLSHTSFTEALPMLTSCRLIANSTAVDTGSCSSMKIYRGPSSLSSKKGSGHSLIRNSALFIHGGQADSMIALVRSTHREQTLINPRSMAADIGSSTVQDLNRVDTFSTLCR